MLRSRMQWLYIGNGKEWFCWETVKEYTDIKLNLRLNDLLYMKERNAGIGNVKDDRDTSFFYCEFLKMKISKFKCAIRGLKRSIIGFFYHVKLSTI